MKKNLLGAFIVLVMLAATNSSFCVPNSLPGYEKILTSFIDSYTKSDYKKLNDILSDDACVKIPRAEKVIIQRKSSLVDEMREEKGTMQACTSKYEVIAHTDAIVIARVDFQYENFKEQNFVTLEKNDNKEWKITQICKVFQNTDKPVAPLGNNSMSAKIN